MPRESVSTRAHRCLRRLQRFTRGTEVLSLARVPSELEKALREGEAIVGAYQNTEPRGGELLVLTEEAVLVESSSGHFERIPFTSIARVETPESKQLDSLQIDLTSGEARILRVLGGGGETRDVFAFLRFFDRVLADLTTVDESHQ